MTDLDTTGGSAHPDEVELNHTGSLAVAVLVGLAVALAARLGATALLVALAAVQALLAFAWVFGTRLPGRKGALVVAALAAAGADVAVSVWPHGRLGTLLAVLGLAVPAMFIHQLGRGAARVRVVESLGGIGLLVLAEVALPSLLQLRHEFGANGGHVAAGVVAAAAGALVVGYLVDLLAPTPRFDPEVPRGLLAVLASAGLGGSLGYLLLQSDRFTDFIDGRGAFIGASVGALVALFAVCVAFIEHNVPMPDDSSRGAGFARRIRPVLGVVMPLSLLAPVAFLLCLAIRA
ncbi:MAG: hypothetical protein ACRDWT_07315 [Jatrophihabitantaceae bacterium]